MWHLTACKISVGLSFLNWVKNEMLFFFFFFYQISELMLATLIQRCDKKSFHFKNERLTEILQVVNLYVGGEGVVYLTTPGRPTDIGLQLGKAFYPCTFVAGKCRGECFYFFCFFPFIHVPLSFLSLSFIFPTISSISFLPFSGRRHKMIRKGWRVVNPNTIKFITFF